MNLQLTSEKNMAKHTLSEDSFRPLTTLESALKVPLKKSGPQDLSSAYCLIGREIFPLVGRFLARQELSFMVASLRLENDREQYLILLDGKGQNPGLIPGFILAYIKALPSCYVFQGFAAPEKNLLFLCEYGFDHPLEIVELMTATTETGLFLSFGDERGRNLIVKPVPEMQSSASILQYDVDFPLPQYDFVATTAPGKLSIPLRFIDIVPDAGKPAAALLLERAEIVWLKGLLYRLPASLFEKIEWIGNQEYLFLFFSETAAISFIPFGQAFRQVSDNFFIPANKEIVPRLDSRQLDNIFAIDSQDYTFVSGSRRWNLPITARAPLSRLLTVDHEIKVEFNPDLNPVEFVWEPPELIDDNHYPVPEPVNGTEDKPIIPESVRFAEAALTTTPETESDNSQIIVENLNKYAALLRSQGDLLGAAICFSLAHDNLNAADCYAAAARELKSG